MLLLAGGASRLPLIWKMAQISAEDGGLAYPAHRIGFAEAKAKRKVALGSALYAYVRNRPLEFDLVPQPATDFVLLPMVHEVGTKSFDCIFPASYHANSDPVEKTYKVGSTARELRLAVWESIDYRKEHWEPDDELKALGMHSPGKSMLTTLVLHFKNHENTLVRHFLKRNGHGRTIEVQYEGPQGLKIEETPI